MRHLRSILYALVLAPAVWILCGVGFDQDLTGRARDNGGIESLSGVLLLLLAGAAYAILLFSPISPAGPALAGLAFLGVGAWARVAPDSYAGVWPANIAKDGFNVSTPGYGLAVLLAVPLLATVLSARRWRGFEPPEIVLIGTIGRARGAAAVAGTPMASERTTVIPQQRPGSGPGFSPGTGPGFSPDAGPGFLPGFGTAGDDDEKTTVMRLGRQPAAEEPTRVTRTAEEATEDLAETNDATATLPGGDDDEATRAITLPDASPHASPSASPDETTRDVTADETTRDVAPGGSSGDETTRLVSVSGEQPQEADEETEAFESADDRTRLLTATTDRGEQTQVIRAGTVEPPGDRTQLLTIPAGSPGAETQENPEATSIVAAERPDPGDDPTTRLSPPAGQPGEATTRANRERPAMTVTNVERPADEAADDTRPLTLPTQRPPAEELTP